MSNMQRGIPLALVALTMISLADMASAGGYGLKNKHLKKPVPIERQSFNAKPLEHVMAIESLPTDFSWGRIADADGEITSLLQPSWNQHIPQASRHFTSKPTLTRPDCGCPPFTAAVLWIVLPPW